MDKSKTKQATYQQSLSQFGLLLKLLTGWVWWLMPAIPATWKAEIRRTAV
jgi:hypothetical protein